MREILFRGKRLNNGEWVEGFYNHLPCGRFGADEHMIQTVLENGKIGMLYDIDPSTVGQYTGLKDKNGKKIFEGDIVKSDNGHISEVTFYFGAFCCYCQCHDTHNTLWSDILTVIGNITDNPELLEK